MQTLPLLSESLRAEREHDGHQIRISLLHPEQRTEGHSHPLPAAARAFLEQYLSPVVLEVFPEWQGILIEVPLLEETVWIVRDHQNGQRLTQETGHPSLLLDEILTQEGQACLKSKEHSLEQITTKGECHDKDAKNVVE